MQGLNLGKGLNLLGSALVGGLSAMLTGGKFLQGALQGLQIGYYNHGMHDEDVSDIIWDGSNELNEVMVLGFRPEPAYFVMHASLEFMNSMSITAHGAGVGISKYSYNSTYGYDSTGKLRLYLKSKGLPGFWGNKYIKVSSLSGFGNTILKRAGPIGNAISLTQVADGIILDQYNARVYGTTGYPNAVKAGAEAIGSGLGCYAGSWAGAKAGAILGASYGSFFGPNGAAAIGLAGAIIGGIAGGFGCSWLVDKMVESIY